MDLNDIQFRILDALYFVEPFERLLEEVGGSEAIVSDELKTLISRRLVQVMRFDETRNDYVKSPVMDVDNMRHYAYLATREGLMAHNGQ
jgi:hypothetical protein